MSICECSTVVQMDGAFNSGVELYDLLVAAWDEKWWTEGSGSLSIPSALSQINTSVDSLIQVRRLMTRKIEPTDTAIDNLDPLFSDKYFIFSEF